MAVIQPLCCATNNSKEPAQARQASTLTDHIYMAHAVAFAAIITTKTREHFAESSYTTQLRVQTMHNTRIALPVAWTIAWAEICLGCWRDRPFSNRTNFVFDEVIPMVKQWATWPDSDEDCIRIGEFPCYSHYAERLARLKQVPIFKVLARPGLSDMKRAL